MSKSIEDLIEPDDDTKFNLSLKQLQFIQNDNNIKIMSSIMKTMKKYKFEIEDINNILDKHIQSETKRIERNEARKSQKSQQKNKNDSNSEDDIKSILSNRSSNTNNRTSKKRSSSRKR